MAKIIGSAALTPGGDSGTDLTNKGDLHGYSSSNTRVPIGDNDQVLTADSAQALGLKWAAAQGLVSPLTADLVFNDDVEAQFGTGGSDSAIYHDGSNLYLKITTGNSICNGNFTMAAAKCLTTNLASATISSGAIVGTANQMKVDTEGGASTDDLDSASFEAAGTTGATFVLFSTNNSRDITIKDQTGSGHAFFLMPSDFTLDTTQDKCTFLAENTMTHNSELCRSNNS